jgi:Flp pilus assembly protein TadG
MFTRMIRNLARLLGDERGAVSAMLVLMLIPLVGMLGIATEASSWYFIQRSMQNAADSSAMAAATNACAKVGCGIYYDVEAKSVASNFGYQNGVNETTVTASNTAICPSDGSAKCYSVTITRKVPIYLTRVVGFTGDAITSGGGPAQTVSATAIASPKTTPNAYCLLALASGGKTQEAITCKGCSKAQMTGCNVATNGTALCTGHDLNADRVDTGGSSNSCASGAKQGINQPYVADPFLSLAANIPAKTCGSSTPGTTWSTNQTLVAAPPHICGNLTVNANVNLSTPAGGSVVVIENGNLNVTGGNTLKTLAGSSVTFIFTGSKAGAGHTVPGNGTLDIAAPTSGTWSGVALYQDPSMTSGVDGSWTGNSPTWKITGLVYMPKATVSFGGIVNKASNGLSCFSLVVDKFEANGTATIAEDQSQCASAGLTPPSGGAPVRQGLVQ